jgi:hypothetical protein
MQPEQNGTGAACPAAGGCCHIEKCSAAGRCLALPVRQTTDILPLDVHLVASVLDHPSIYMGGPSRQSIAKARRVLAALRREGFLSNASDGR